MAKWTLGILDGGGWGCRRCDDGLWAGLDGTVVYSYRMLRATMDYLSTTLIAEITLQPISEIMSMQISKVMQFISPLLSTSKS